MMQRFFFKKGDIKEGGGGGFPSGPKIYLLLNLLPQLGISEMNIYLLDSNLKKVIGRPFS